MTALELRLIAYGLAMLLLLGGSAWLGYHFTAAHYERVIADDKAAQALALQSAQQNVIAAQQAQAAAIQQAEKDHETLVQADTASRNAILGSVRSLETALHLSGLSAAVDPSGKSGGAAPSTSRADGLADLVERVNAATERAVSACQHDSSELASVLEIAPH